MTGESHPHGRRHDRHERHAPARAHTSARGPVHRPPPRPAGATGPGTAPAPKRRSMSPLRLWLPAAIIVAGFIVLAVRPDETGLEGWAMLVGAGLSVWLFNFFFRMGVSGDRDREREEAARRYLDEHGRWPDER